ncbi:uncharacterized protein LOC112171858 isoform X3 [Rosa chinensis]|uniref:uncharacterized protein LOC112171858 isoform X3 n=1 Tax=Rosa chinensis TaxID=74649 RepID=UPI001AD8ED39|nr:uncharacterized protein LOC112171858 isoform X3 [Rosa chinensis]
MIKGPKNLIPFQLLLLSSSLSLSVLISGDSESKPHSVWERYPATKIEFSLFLWKRKNKTKKNPYPLFPVFFQATFSLHIRSANVKSHHRSQMDKQLARRFKQSSGHKLFSGAGGDFVLLEKSKKERIRKLSTIGRGATCSSLEMDCDVSHREDEEELPSKRIKLPRKSMGDSNGGVHLASVPRKLRSAMKKRHRQSTSPSLSNSRKLLGGTESLNCDGVKKPCLKQGDRSPKETVSGPITKDEEEVVETLYALAGLVFPNNEANGNGKVESETLDANASALPESKNSPAPAVEVGDIKLDPVFPCRATSSTSPSYVEGFTKGTDQVDLLNNPSTHYQPEFPNSGTLCIDSNNNVSHNQINISSLSAKVEQCNEKRFSNAVNFRDPSELSLDSRRLTQTVQQLTSVFSRKPEIAVELGTNIGSQVQKHDMLQESREKGSGLWPGLASNVSHGAKSDSPLLHPAATMPPWMDAALSTSRASIQNGSSFAKVTKVVNGTRSCKKCAAHVYISHLIQSLKSSDSKDQLLLQPCQMRAHEGSEQGAFLGVNTYTNVKSGFNEVVSSSSIRISTAEKVSNEAKNGILQHKMLRLDQPSYTLASGAHTSPKQIFDFLSLSAGGGSSGNNDSFSRGRYAMEPSSEAQVPYLHSPVQHHNLIPFPLTRSRYSSSASLDSHPPVAQQGQLLPSYSNPFCVSQANVTALTKQPIQQQKLHLQQQQQQFHLQQHQQQQLHLQQQQQRFWAAQFAAQYRPAGTLAATAPSPSWQNIKQENCTLNQCGQALLSPSPSTLELVGPKYAPLSHQQQQQMPVTSFPPDRVKLSDHHLPSVYEESVGGYRAASALPLQLLCNERL